MLNLNSVMIGTKQPQALAAFYEKVIGKPADMVDKENGFFGWQEIAAKVDQAMAEQEAEFPASASWGIGSRLGFAMQRADVLPVSINVNAFDYWVEPDDYIGKDAVVVTEAEEDHLLSNVARYFSSLEPIETIEISRFGRVLKTYRLSLGRDYRPPENGR